jgi:hypothetical protein
MITVDTITTYVASCTDCNWEGPDRDVRVDALRDAEVHICPVTTSNGRAAAEVPLF